MVWKNLISGFKQRIIIKKKNQKSNENNLKTYFEFSFLNLQDKNDCFTEDFISILPQDDRVECFVDYILENDVSKSSDCPPEM